MYQKYFLTHNVKKTLFMQLVYEPHDKTNEVTVRPVKTQISLGIRPVWSASSLSAWRKLGSLATHWAHSEDPDQTGRIPRLIWVFAWRTLTLLVLSRGGSNVFEFRDFHGCFIACEKRTRSYKSSNMHPLCTYTTEMEILRSHEKRDIWLC